MTIYLYDMLARSGVLHLANFDSSHDENNYAITDKLFTSYSDKFLDNCYWKNKKNNNYDILLWLYLMSITTQLFNVCMQTCLKCFDRHNFTQWEKKFAAVDQLWWVM